MSNNLETIFNHNQEIIIIQVNLKEKLKDIIKKYENKSGIQNVYYIYSGNQINNDEYTVEEIINLDDKISKKMRILVNDIQRTTINDKIINIKDIICPICKESIKMKIKEYKINLYGCKNGHSKENILLEEFDNIENESGIKCGKCENNINKVYNNIFYKCNNCEINLCPLCESIHDKAHNTINYEEKNYMCNIHNERYNSYCEECKKNICMECEQIHNNHKIISYGKIIPNKKEIERRKNELIEKSI